MSHACLGVALASEHMVRMNPEQVELPSEAPIRDMEPEPGPSERPLPITLAGGGERVYHPHVGRILVCVVARHGWWREAEVGGYVAVLRENSPSNLAAALSAMFRSINNNVNMCGMYFDP